MDGLLIDTGQSLVGKDFVKLLEDERVDKIIVTHHHEDHSGNVERIKEAKGADAFGSLKCSEIMKKPTWIEPARLISWGQNKAANINPLELSKSIQTENFEFQIFETPGHAIDQISLYEPDKGWLFPGDLFVHDYIKTFMRDEDLAQQIQSLEMLMKLDFEVMFCHHQPVFDNAKERLKSKLNFLVDFYGKVEDAYNKGMSSKQIMSHMRLKEQKLVKFISLGQLSTLNMVKSVVNDLKF